MRQDELKAVFDRQAAGYDAQWARLAPIRDGLHFLLESVFAELPAEARLLCVGVATGAELTYLARRFPRWSFTAIEPSGAMLDICRARADEGGYASRCRFHEGYVDSLAADHDGYDGATCFLVSQFITERDARVRFFRSIADKLRPGGVLASSDLASDIGSQEFEALFRVWCNVMAAGGMQPEALERMRAAYAKDVAVLPPPAIASIIESGGFEPPVRFYQAGLIHAWFAKRLGTTP